jgi:hypothetical protein
MRQAQCNCGELRPSDPGLPFFEDLGEGSRHATRLCVCGYTDEAHGEFGGPVECKGGFRAKGPAEHDSWYCGHNGFD